jgi:hypothetical protein
MLVRLVPAAARVEAADVEIPFAQLRRRRPSLSTKLLLHLQNSSPSLAAHPRREPCATLAVKF